MNYTNNALTALFLINLVACGASSKDGDDASSDTGSDSGESPAAYVPVEGSWDFVADQWIDDGCYAADNIQSPAGIQFSSVTESGLTMVVSFPDGSNESTTCTLDSNQLACDTIEMSWWYETAEKGTFYLDANVVMEFTSETEANYSTLLDIRCEGTRCDAYVAQGYYPSLPCSATHSAKLIYID